MAGVPDPHSPLAMAAFAAHLAEDERARQEERYADAALRFLYAAPAEAVKTLEAWHGALHGAGGRSLFDAIKEDPHWRLAQLPPEYQKVPA